MNPYEKHWNELRIRKSGFSWMLAVLYEIHNNLHSDLTCTCFNHSDFFIWFRPLSFEAQIAETFQHFSLNQKIWNCL